ncbi:MAG: 16S rRNA (guanine(527)-N(7))-methyltransferase RsmG [Ruminococcus sp.]|jgi:16S rRNA (guanine527-N7)-methyltransferase|nr:16S rRNA (guanine(527)-N(7))-methyltransferase RsmG [Ruminococcus sp.]
MNIDEVFKTQKIILSKTELKQFSTYSTFLREYNEKVNLTAITDPEEIAVKHFLDSVLPLTFIAEDAENLLDIGTGAGFPGVPMAIMNPKTRVTLLEANGKKIAFLNELVSRLSLPNVTVLSGRAEDLAAGPLRESFEIVTARAFAPFSQLVEYTMPFVSPGGNLLVMKGSSETYEDGASAVEALGGDLEDFVEYTLPNGDMRRLFIIEKISKTPRKYPRSNALIKKSPLK